MNKKSYKRQKRANNSMAMHEVIRNEGQECNLAQSNSFSISKSKKRTRQGRFLPFFFERDGIGRLIPNQTVNCNALIHNRANRILRMFSIENGCSIMVKNIQKQIASLLPEQQVLIRMNLRKTKIISI